MLQRTHRVLLPLLALAAILPMCFTGPSCGHDFDFHLLSWLEASTQFAHGAYPVWTYTPAWNAGEPRFLFYPPLSWTLGAVLGLLGPDLLHSITRHADRTWNAVPIVFTWICLALSGLTAHRFVRRYSSPGAALLAATLYLLNPYMLFTAYERTAYGELLAAVWMPLLFAAALTRGPAILQILRIALPITLLWLTNAPAAVMGCYALAVLTLCRLVLPNPQTLDVPYIARRSGARCGFSTNPRLTLALTTLAGTFLGLLLPAFYLLPAAYERRFISSNMAVVIGMRPPDNTLFHHMLPATDDTLYHDQVLHSASCIALLLLCGIALSGLGLWLRFARQRRVAAGNPPGLALVLPPVLLAGVVAFLLTPASLPVWSHTPELTFLQFPWRLCALLAPVVALVTALLLSHPPRPSRYLSSFGAAGGSASRLPLLASVALAALLITPAWRDFHQPCDSEDTVDARVALFHSPLGTDPTDEYTPANADADQLHPHDPPFWLVPEFASAGSCTLPCTLALPPAPSVDTAAPADAQPGQAPRQLTLNLPFPEFLILNRRAYPAWQVRRNCHAVPPDQLRERNDGLIALALPAGPSTIDLTLVRTPDRTLGLLLSLLALLLAAVLAWAGSRDGPPGAASLSLPGQTNPVHSDG